MFLASDSPAVDTALAALKVRQEHRNQYQWALKYHAPYLYKEDKLEKMKAKHSFSLSMDITMTKGIIELKFDESKFSTEELLTVIKAYQAGKKYVILKDNTFLDIVNPSTKLLNDIHLH